MIGILVQLALSWLLAWLFEKGNLGILGLSPSRGRLIDFALFFSVSAACCALDFILKMWIAHQQWALNPAITLALILESLWWNIKAVLFEELIFRGVLLYILLRKLGPPRAITISAITFGVYHWFSQELFGNPQAMVITFIVTGLMGLLLAYSYAKTYSLYTPVAIHLGWNLTRQFVFSDGPIGNQLYIEVMPRLELTVSYPAFFLMLLLPLVSLLAISYWVLKQHKQAELPSG